MPKPIQPITLSDDFPGLITNADPRDLPPGAAAEQLNLACLVQGEMRTRLGIREVVFESARSSVT